jgi:hypothetical protein
MEIKKQVYQYLTPSQRAAAVYAAINRADGNEGARLVGHAPRGEGHGKAILGLGQALDVYNLFAAYLTREILLQVNKATSSSIYCQGWLDAGGAPDDGRHLKRYSEAGPLLAKAVSMMGELEAVKQAAREWFEDSGIPLEALSGPMSFMPLSPKPDTAINNMAPADEEVLENMRSLFKEIKLTW